MKNPHWIREEQELFSKNNDYYTNYGSKTKEHLAKNKIRMNRLEQIFCLENKLLYIIPECLTSMRNFGCGCPTTEQAYNDAIEYLTILKSMHLKNREKYLKRKEAKNGKASN